MKTYECARLATGTILLMTLMAPASVWAGEPYVPQFTLDKRAVARSFDHYGDLPLGAVIRTNERYGGDSIFQGRRGWDYWNRPEDPRLYQDPNLWPDKRPTSFWPIWRCRGERTSSSTAGFPT